MKNGLKSRVFRLGGVHHGGWWTPIIVFFDAAEKVAIGKKSYYQAKVYYHAKVRGFRDSIMRKGKRSRILLVLGERRICLTENAVDKRGI